MAKKQIGKTLELQKVEKLTVEERLFATCLNIYGDNAINL